MKKGLKAGALLMALLFITGCSSVVKDHAAAVEQVITLEAKEKTEETSDSSASSSSETRESGKGSSASSEEKTEDSADALDGNYEPTIQEMRDILLENGLITEGGVYSDFEIPILFANAGVTFVDEALWEGITKNIDYDDLEEQIKTQYEKQQEDDKERTSYDYKIKIKLPNIEKIELEDVSFEEPKIKYGDMYTQTSYFSNYEDEVKIALRTGLRNYLSGKNKAKTQNYELTVTLTEQEDGEPEATVDSENLNALKEKISAQELVFLEDCADTEAVQNIRLLENIKEELETGIPAALAPTISDISEADDKGMHTLTVVYIGNLTEALNALRDKSNAEYKSDYPNGMYTAIDDTTVKNNMALLYKTSKSEFSYEKEEFEVRSLGSNAYLEDEDLNAILEKIKSESSRVSTEVKTYVDNNLMNKVQERPATGVKAGASAGSPIAVELPSGNSRDYYIKFIQISGTDMSEEGNEVLTAYIRAGESLSISLPGGNYKMRFATGDGAKWYGDKNTFGPDGRYSQGANVVTIQNNYTYTLTLYGVSNGNLPIDSLDQGDF